MLNKIKEKILSQNPEQTWILDNCVFLHYAGSQLYGTNRPDSDVDIRGVTIAPKKFWIGTDTFEQIELKTDTEDIVIYDIRKFIKSIARVSPNTVESLFVPENQKIITSDKWEWLLRNQITKLINKSAYDAYHGYSLSQIKKMAIKQANKTGRQYITEEFGFDLKFAAHGFRLIEQGYELLTTGKITFPRPDAQRLKDMRAGLIYNRNQLDKCLADWEEEAKKLEFAKQNSPLPSKPDYELHNKILINIFDTFVNSK